jgi:hypothetical protein
LPAAASAAACPLLLLLLLLLWLQVHLSVVEIYCERIRDLLDPVRDNLQVKQEPGGAIFIEGRLHCC